MDQEADAGDDQQHDERELVEDEAEVDLQRADVNPMAENDFDIGSERQMRDRRFPIPAPQLHRSGRKKSIAKHKCKRCQRSQ